MKASTTARLDKLGKRIREAPDPPRFPFVVVSMSDWEPGARAAYRAACDRGDWAEANEIEAGQTGIPAPHDPPTGKRRPYGFPRAIVQLIVDDADPADPVDPDDDDEPTRTVRDAEPEPSSTSALAAPIVEPPGNDPNDVVGRDGFGYPETRQDRTNRLAADERLKAAGQEVPGPPVFDRWGGLVSGTYQPPAPSTSSYMAWDRNGKRIV